MVLPTEIIAVTTSVNYHDILKHNLDNLKHFKIWYIIVSPEDDGTVSLVRDIPNIKILIYDGFYKNAKFNFGGSRLFAQEYINKNHESSNILFLDADIYLPSNLNLPLVIENDTIYGTSERIDYHTLDDFINGKNPHKYRGGHHFNGFFQLYKQSPKYLYKNSDNCSQCDGDFRDLFKNKINLNLSVKHLGQDGIHWNGRDKSNKIK